MKQAIRLLTKRPNESGWSIEFPGIGRMTLVVETPSNAALTATQLTSSRHLSVLADRHAEGQTMSVSH